jgi:hypothetical protein
MHIAAEKMADNFNSAIARVYRICDSKGNDQKTCLLWLFQVFALTAGLYGYQVWAIFSLTYENQPLSRPSSWHPEKTPGCQGMY